jgi:hypothetical protein
VIVKNDSVQVPAAHGPEFGHFVAIMIEWAMADVLRLASVYSAKEGRQA